MHRKASREEEIERGSLRIKTGAHKSIKDYNRKEQKNWRKHLES